MRKEKEEAQNKTESSKASFFFLVCLSSVLLWLHLRKLRHKMSKPLWLWVVTLCSSPWIGECISLILCSLQLSPAVPCLLLTPPHHQSFLQPSTTSESSISATGLMPPGVLHLTSNFRCNHGLAGATATFLASCGDFQNAASEPVIVQPVGLETDTQTNTPVSAHGMKGHWAKGAVGGCKQRGRTAVKRLGHMVRNQICNGIKCLKSPLLRRHNSSRIYRLHSRSPNTPVTLKVGQGH